jgi:cytochrome c
MLLALVASAAQGLERGRDPFVFRAVLDDRPRMLVLALRQDLWMAYDAERAALYKIWEGGIDFRGAVYDWTHGPQPTSRGRVWWVSPWEEPWQIVQGGVTHAARVRYRGHRLDAGRASLLYDVGLDGGPWVRVEESPDVFEEPRSARGIVRRFTASGPDGVGLRLRFGRLRPDDSIRADGRLETGRGGDAVLVLRPEGTTTLSVWLGEPEEPTPDAPLASSVLAGEALVASSDCAVCHAPDRRTVGPSYLEIAEHYEDREEEIARLARRVMVGGSGVWGEVPMTPHPDLSSTDAEAMVAWILSLADPDPESLPAWRRSASWRCS